MCGGGLIDTGVNLLTDDLSKRISREASESVDGRTSGSTPANAGGSHSPIRQDLRETEAGDQYEGQMALEDESTDV